MVKRLEAVVQEGTVNLYELRETWSGINQDSPAPGSEGLVPYYTRDLEVYLFMKDAEAERTKLQRQVDRRLRRMTERSKLAAARRHGIPSEYGNNFRVEFSYIQHQVPIRQLTQRQSVAYWRKPSTEDPVVIN